MAAEDDDDDDEEEDDDDTSEHTTQRERRSWTLARYDEPDCWCTRYTSVVLTTSRSTERVREDRERRREENRLGGKKEVGTEEARGE